jgi:hypothetical protein
MTPHPPAQAVAAATHKTGIQLIAAERARQVTQEGYSSDHDDEHKDGSLRVVAAMLACEGTDASVEDALERDDWGLLRHDPIRRLEIAGALLAAEIDRLQRAAFARLGESRPAQAVAARPITPENPPKFPCWLWRASTRHTERNYWWHCTFPLGPESLFAFPDGTACTHWHPDQPEAPARLGESRPAGGQPETVHSDDSSQLPRAITLGDVQLAEDRSYDIGLRHGREERDVIIAELHAKIARLSRELAEARSAGDERKKDSLQLEFRDAIHNAVAEIHQHGAK